MEEVENKEVVEEVTQETPPVEEVAEEQKPEVDLSKFESKDNDDVIKVDLSTPVETEQTNEVETNVEEAIEEVAQEEDVDNETPALEEITNEEVVTEEEVVEALESGGDIPENVQKLMDFMNETGGDLQDYVNLNRDVKDLDNQEALLEYYKRTKPHLDSEEISFLMEDNFSFDEDIDDERDIKRKKLALKEQVAEAKTYLDGQKSKYYEEIKAGSKLTKEQQKAINFFDRYNKESAQTEKATKRERSVFNKKTEQVFNDKFKGFEYNVGEKKFRFNVKDADQTKETQSDINNFFKKFLNEDNTMNDAKGYHKGLYTAMNPDAVANHFYEQGKADALKDSVAKAKNINTTARPSHGEAQTGGMKVKVLGDDSASFKFKIKNKK
jgi:antitoxin component HigA of HigAB toxin-antitoxin module